MFFEVYEYEHFIYMLTNIEMTTTKCACTTPFKSNDVVRKVAEWVRLKNFAENV